MLEFTDLSVRYGVGIEALNQANLSIPEGKVTSVIGGNGAGKSTLMRAASGILSFHGGVVTSGDITFGGESLLGKTAPQIVEMGLVHVPEGRRIFGDLTVIENLRAGGATVKSGKKRESELKRVLELFPILAERRNQRAGGKAGDHLFDIAEVQAAGNIAIGVKEFDGAIDAVAIAVGDHIGQTVQARAGQVQRVKVIAIRAAVNLIARAIGVRAADKGVAIRAAIADVGALPAGQHIIAAGAHHGLAAAGACEGDRIAHVLRAAQNNVIGPFGLN